MAKYKRNSVYDSRGYKRNYRGYKQCYSKKGYTTTHDANTMIHHQAKKFGVQLRYYKCPLCHRYHLTKKEVSE